MTNEPQNQYRQKLGSVLEFALRGRQDAHIADKIGIKAQDVKLWRSGALVPSENAWARLTAYITDLRQHAELCLRARAEQEREREAIVAGLRRPGPAPSVAVTNLGDKLRQAIPSTSDAPDPPAAPPETSTTQPVGYQNPGAYARAAADLGTPIRYAADGRAASPPRPDGSMSVAARSLRRQYVRDILRERPNAPATGPDGVISMVRRRFGIGIQPGEVAGIRRELAAGPTIHPPTAPAAAAPPPATVAPAPIAAAAAVATPAPAPDLSAAIELVLGAIPGLRTMRIDVGESGEASVTYEIRETRTVAGSLTMRR